MIKVLGLALYGPMAASHRVRLGQYRMGLLAHGIDLRVQSLLGNNYLKSRFQGGRGWGSLLSLVNAGLERIKLLLSKDYFDVAIVHCELFPFAPGWLESVALRIPYIYDFDDAFYLRYRGDRFEFLHFLLGGKFDAVMRRAAAITAGNAYLANYARVLNSNVSVLPSVVDTQNFYPGTHHSNPVFTIGWVGSPSTAEYLQGLVAPFRLLGLDGPLRFVVVGGKAPRIEGVEVIESSWSEKTEVDLIRTFDVGVMPLPDNEWTRGKCAFKLVQYMACGIPVVASRAGANIDLVTEECGFLADTNEQWISALKELQVNTLKRKNMGIASRARVVDAYSLEKNLPVLANIIHKVIR